MKTTLCVLAVGLAVGALVSRGVAEEKIVDALGAFTSHRTEERFDISVGATRQGDLARETRRVEFRETVVVPDHYGSVLTVTAAGDRSIVWYVDEGGVVRNVVLEEADRKIYRLEQNGSKLSAVIRRPY